MPSAKEILKRVDRGEDPELAKLVDKRASEQGVSRLEALERLLGER